MSDPRLQPVVEAVGLGLTGPEGPVFADVSLAVATSRLTVVVGPSGTGRSSLLLALTGRMRGTTGVLLHGGRPVVGRRDLRELRQASSVARLAALVVPEPRLSVAQSIAERALLDGVRPVAAERAFATTEAVLDVRLDRSTLVEQLSASDRSALCVALALVRPADLVVLDDADAGLDLTDQRSLLTALCRLAASGPAVVVTTTEAASVPAEALPIHLATPQEAR